MADAEAAGQRTESRCPCSVEQPLFLHQGKVEEEGNPKEMLLRPQCERLQQFLSGGLK